tara:strand:- start:1035 stop:1670 length:636 start_codon:yes stop_codon:yes gene_type:complete
MNQKQLRALIQEQVSEMMSEQEVAEAPDADAPDTTSPTSVDEQIDELLLQYEKLSLPSEEEELLEMMKNASLRMILEQEEVDVEVDAEEEEGEADAEAEAETEEGEADSEEETEEAPAEKVPSLDIGSFALKVARLAEMPEKVLDLKDAIINRSIQYLQTNYNDNVAKEFESALMDRFQLAVPEEEVEVVVASDLPSPPAVGAGPGGAAGG